MASRTLVPYQDRGVEKGRRRKKMLLLMTMGLGKTPVSSVAAALEGCKRWIIQCPDTATSVWRDDAADWIRQTTGKKVVAHHVSDHSWNRAIDWNTPSPVDEIHLYIVTYNTFAIDMGCVRKVRGRTKKQPIPKPRICNPPQGFDCMILDEFKRIRNRDSAAFVASHKATMVFELKCVFELTGTPVSKLGPLDLWTALHVLDRKRFASYWQYEQQYTIKEFNGFADEIVGWKNLDHFHKILQEHSYIVDENDPGVAGQLPPSRRILYPISPDADQRRLYNALMMDMVAILPDGELVVAINSFAKMLRLRQILCCPRLLGEGLSYGAPIKNIMDMVDNEELIPPFVIFSPFVEALHHFKDYILSRKFPHVQILQGGMGTPARDRAIADYRGSNGIILVSIAYAEAYSLEPATKSFFIGWEYDPNTNDQAMRRLVRFTSDSEVPISHYFFTHEQTVERRMVEIIIDKREIIDLTIPMHIRDLQVEPLL